MLSCKKFRSLIPPLSAEIYNHRLKWLTAVILVFAFSVLVLTFLFWSGGEVVKRPDRQDYAIREVELITAQQSSPDKALKLAETLIRDYPQKCMAYEIVANIYSIQKNFNAAETTLNAAIGTCTAPPALYVRLGRFYQRTAPQKLPLWVDSMLKRKEVKNSPALAARLLGIGGRQYQAIQYLEAASRTSSYSFETCVVLSRLYRDRRQPAKALAVLKDFADRHGVNQRIAARLLTEMFSTPLAFDRHQIDFCLRLIVQSAADETGYVQARKKLSENLQTLMRFDAKHHIHGLIRANLKRLNDQHLWVWLDAIFLQSIEKPQAAYAMLTGYQPTDLRLLEEKARLSVYSRDREQISRSWQGVLDVFPDDFHLRLSYAQSLNRAGFKVESRQAAARLDQSPVPENVRWDYFSLCFDNEAALSKHDALVTTWLKAGNYYTYNDFLSFRKQIFHHFKENEDYLKILTLLQINQLKTPAAAEAGALLKVFVAEELRDQKLYFAVADEYLSRKSVFDAGLINVFVDSAIDLAALQHKQGNTAVFPQAAQFAHKWSAMLTERHPDNLAYKSRRMISAYLAGKTSRLDEECRKLLIGHETNHQQLKLLAGRLCRIGSFRIAASYYKKAIGLRPDILRYQFNYAGCLVQLHQYRQAIQIYTGLITRPPDRAWDIEEVLNSLWLCYRHLNCIADFSTLIDSLTTDPAVDANALRLAAGAVFLKKERFRQAEAMFKIVIKNSPSKEDRYSAYLKLAKCYAIQKNYAAAVGIFSTCLQKYPRDVLKRIDCLYNRAEMRRRKGAYQAAIEDWQMIAHSYPADDLAPLALLRAASVAQEKMHDRSQAGRLYEACLALSQNDKKITAIAREKLATIRRQNR